MDVFFFVALLAVLIVERIFSYVLSAAIRRDIDALRGEMTGVSSEFIKLATLLQAFLMNVRFRDDGGVEGARSTDTQVLVSAKEMAKLREIERLLREQQLDRIFRDTRRDDPEQDADDDEGVLK